MKKQPARKLALRTEAVVRLQTIDLAGAHGGMPPTRNVICTIYPRTGEVDCPSPTGF